MSFNEFIVNTLGEINFKFLAAAIVEYKKAKEKSLNLYNDVFPTLNKLLDMGLRLGIVSDAHSREAWIRLYSLMLHNKFEHVVTFNDTGFHKPAKEPFLKISEKLKLELSECMMVGDWPDRDIQGAKQVGMKTAFAKYGDVFNTKKSGADYDLKDISELLDIIKKTNNL